MMVKGQGRPNLLMFNVKSPLILKTLLKDTPRHHSYMDRGISILAHLGIKQSENQSIPNVGYLNCVNPNEQAV